MTDQPRLFDDNDGPTDPRDTTAIAADLIAGVLFGPDVAETHPTTPATGGLTKEQWRAIRDAAEDLLADAAGELDGVRRMMREIFPEIIPAGPYGRRPVQAIRLPVQGDPPARLILRPGWDSSRKEIDPSHLTCTLSVAHDCGRGEPKDREDLSFAVSGDHPPYLWRYNRAAEGNIRRSLEALAAFGRDPAEVFRRNRSRCGICGRKLTDETSRARGVGPECAIKLRFVRAIVVKWKDGRVVEWRACVLCGRPLSAALPEGADPRRPSSPRPLCPGCREEMGS